MPSSRYQLVDSLYGPGTVGAWLLTLCTVLISWTLNTSSRRKDTITVDFIAALLLPLIASGHVMFQLARLPISVAEAITTQDVELQMHALALEAPLNICETFSMTALVLAICCGPWWASGPKWKRLVSILVTGLLSWSTENMMFVMAMIRGVHVTDITLSRPYLFFLTPIVTSTWVFLASCLIIFVVTMLVEYLARGQKQKDSEKAPRLRLKKRTSDKSDRSIQHSIKFMKDRTELLETRNQYYDPANRSARVSKYMTLVTVLYLPFTFAMALFGLLTSNMADISYATASAYRFYLIPKSAGSLHSLDQILALVGGILTLLAAVHGAYRSWTHKEILEPMTTRLKRRRSV